MTWIVDFAVVCHPELDSGSNDLRTLFRNLLPFPFNWKLAEPTFPIHHIHFNNVHMHSGNHIPVTGWAIG
jgi:hypothetical protein